MRTPVRKPLLLGALLGTAVALCGPLSLLVSPAAIQTNVNVVDCAAYGAKPSATAAANTTAIQNAITAAQATGQKRVVLKAGTYPVTAAAGTLFSLTADGLEFAGEGAGKTVLQFANNVTLTGDTFVFTLTGKGQSLHDLSILNGTGMAATTNQQWVGVQVYDGCLDPSVHDLEIAGCFSGDPAGRPAAGLTTYQTLTSLEYPATTLGTTIAAGVRTVTPPVMDGVHAGRIVWVGGSSPEYVTVTSVGYAGAVPVNFVATFTNAHLSTDPVQLRSLAEQRAVLERVTVRDARTACGFVINSRSNTLRNCKAVACGNANTLHGFYIQGGNNLFEKCLVQGAGGYSYHHHVANASYPDQSGNVYLGCVSLDPVKVHFYSDTVTGDGTDPRVPSGTSLNRYSEYIGCTLRDTYPVGPGVTQVNGLDVTGAVRIQGCFFEDASYTNEWVKVGSNAVVEGNFFRETAGATFDNTNRVAVRATGTGTVVRGNQIPTWTAAACIKADADLTVDGNVIGHTVPFNTTNQFTVNAVGRLACRNNTFAFTNPFGSGNWAVNPQGAAVIANNVFTVDDGGTGLAHAIGGGNGGALDISGNTITCVNSARAFNWLNNLTGAPVRVHDNTWGGGTKPVAYVYFLAGQDWYDNDGQVTEKTASTHNMPLTRAAGRLLPTPANANAWTGKLAVKLDYSGNCGTGDTQWAGIAVADKDTDTGSVNLVAGYAPGQVVTVTCSTAWTAGHVAVLSTTVAGNVMDNGGTTPPAAPASYGVFLDSGGAPGDATVLIQRAGR